MRAFLMLLIPSALSAQPVLPDLAITLARNDHCRPMKGPFAESAAMREVRGTKRRVAWSVDMHFTVSADYPYGEHEIGTHQRWALVGVPVRRRRKALQFTILDCFCTGQYLLITQGDVVMRIDVPDPGLERTRSRQLMARRKRPACIEFRQGRFDLADLLAR